MTGQQDALPRLSRVVGHVGELQGRVLAAADVVALDDGARDAAAWPAHRARRDQQPHGSLKLAVGLSTWVLVGAGSAKAG